MAGRGRVNLIPFLELGIGPWTLGLQSSDAFCSWHAVCTVRIVSPALSIDVDTYVDEDVRRTNQYQLDQDGWVGGLSSFFPFLLS